MSTMDTTPEGRPFIVVEAESKTELEARVEAAWREGYRPVGGIALNRDPVNYKLYYVQGMMKPAAVQ